MSGDILHQIQTLQFADRSGAEALLLAFLGDVLKLDVVAVELRPLAVSLNSFNGFMTLADGKRLFFKTHSEPDGVISEYYHATLLAEVGYPIIQPVYRSTESGKQLLVYEIVSDPSIFDVAWAIENGQAKLFPPLQQAQYLADVQLLNLYQETLTDQSAENAAAAPIHQLFYHRLVNGRLARFYGPVPGDTGTYPLIDLPGGVLKLEQVRQVKWVINGQQYTETLDEIILRAVSRLEPAQAGPSIVGHGDAHNGNIFFCQREPPPSLTYFDPAFAGRHHPLLDLTKPLFHNVFAMWMYFPDIKRQQTNISLKVDAGIWRVEHNYFLHPVREMFFKSKIEYVLVPILRILNRQNQLRSDWHTYLKAALFCCPFLTMNLADSSRFSPEISLLGLAMAVEMGAESQGKRSLIDRTLDEVDSLI